MLSGGRRSTISGRFFDVRTQVRPTAPCTPAPGRPDQWRRAPADGPATGAARRMTRWQAEARVDDVEPCRDLQVHARWCARAGRDGRPAAHFDTVPRLRQVGTARRAAEMRTLYCGGGRLGSAFVLAPLRTLDTVGVLDAGGAGALDGTGGLRRPALFAMFLQELAHQLLVAPVQLPFEVACAHLAGFARGEERSGLRESGLGPAHRRQSDAGDVERTSREPRRRHGHRLLPRLPRAPYQNAAAMSRGRVGGPSEAIHRKRRRHRIRPGTRPGRLPQGGGGCAVPAQWALKSGRPTA